MPRLAEIEGAGTIEFPDDATDEEIASAVNSHFAPNPPQLNTPSLSLPPIGGTPESLVGAPSRPATSVLDTAEIFAPRRAQEAAQSRAFTDVGANANQIEDDRRRALTLLGDRVDPQANEVRHEINADAEGALQSLEQGAKNIGVPFGVLRGGGEDKPIVNVSPETVKRINPMGGMTGRLAWQGLSKLLPEQTVNTVEKIGSGTAEGAAEALSSLTSPSNLAILVTGAGAPKAASQAIMAYFSAEMLKGVAPQVMEGTRKLEAGDIQGAAKDFTGAAVGLGMAVAPMAHRGATEARVEVPKDQPMLETPTVKDSLTVPPETKSEPTSSSAVVAPETKPDVLTLANIESATPEQLGKLKHRDGIAFGLTVGPEAVPDLQSKYEAASKEMTEAASGKGDMKAAFGKYNYYGGALMGATRGAHPISGTNFKLFTDEQATKPYKPSFTPEPTTKSEAVAESELASVGPGAAAAGEVGTYRPIQQLTDQLSVIGKDKPTAERIDAISKAPVGSRIKESLTEAVGKASAVQKVLWDAYSKAPKWTDEKKAAGNWFGTNQRADHEARMFTKQIEKTVPNKLRREAITNWIQADGDVAVLKSRAEASKPSVKPGYEAAQKLTPKELEVAITLRDYFDRQLERGIGEDILRDGLDNYVTQVWKKENPITKQLRMDFAPGKLPTNFKFARKRIFDSYFEGEQAGFKPANKDIGALVGLYDQSFNRTLSARAYVKELSEGTASDGRPLVEVSGSGKVLDASTPAKVLIKPKTKPEEISDYRVIDHPALRGWKYVTSTPEGAPVLLQGDLLVHPEAYSKLKNRLSVSAWRQNPVGRAILGTQSTLKQTMLSVSGFHQAQETIHSLGHRVNPANLAKLDFERPIVRDLASHGLQLADYHAMEAFSEGLSSGALTNKIPLIGTRILKPYTEWLFQDYIPRLKLTLAEHALERNTKRYPKLSRDQILELTANQANAAFGELPYRYWGRSPTLQDTLRAFLLAPDFLEARARFVGQAAKPYGREQMVALGLIAATTYMTARVMNQILDDDPHWEMKHAFSILYKGHAYTLRTVPGDILHLISDPRSFSYHRLSPLIGRGSIEALTGRDDRGVKRDILEQVKDMASSGVPISLRKRDDQKIWEAALNSIGVGTRRFTAINEIGDLAKDFREKHGKKESFEFAYDADSDAMRPLRVALQSHNEEAAAVAIKELSKTMPPIEIKKRMRTYYTRPFSGSKALEKKFVESLTPRQKEVYQEARDEQAAQHSLFNRALDK